MSVSKRIAGLCGFALWSGTAIGEPLTILPSAPIAPFVAAAPRLAGDDMVSQAINAVRAELDAIAREIWTDCGTTAEGDFDAAVIVDMAGPDFFGINVPAGGYCPGAAHPFSDDDHRVMALATGQSIDPLDQLPAMFRPNDTEDTAVPPAGLRVIAL